MLYLLSMGMVITSNRDFEKFFREFYPAVYAFLVHYTGDSELAANLAQDTFLKVYEQREQVVSIEYGKAFLYTTARYLYWNYRKHEQAHQNYLKQLSEQEEEDYDFLREVTKEETVRVLYAAIDKLPPRAREVILLNLKGKDNGEVALALNISLNTVKSLKKSAYSILRKLLAKDYYLILMVLLGD